MALRDLSTAIMVSLTSTWVDRKHPDRQSLAAVPESAGLLKRVETVHRALLKMQVPAAGPATPPRMTAIKAESASADQRHDDAIRGVWWYLGAMSVLHPDPARRKAFLALRERLLPQGLAHTKMKYRAEAGEAVLAHARMTDDDRATLAALPTPAGALADAVGQWFAEAARLGQLEHERATLEAPAGVSAADVQKTRNDWIRVVTAVRTALGVVDDLPAEVSTILDRVAEAERQAAGHDAAPEDDVPGDGNPANDTATDAARAVA